MKRIKEEEAFTLIEILIVVVIIAAFTALVGPELFSRVSQANQTAAAKQIDVFKLALNNYWLDNGEFPSSSEGLKALVEKPNSASLERWNGPYLERKEIPKDPWGNEYNYQCPGKHNSHKYDLWSYGKDNKEGGSREDADITNW